MSCHDRPSWSPYRVVSRQTGVSCHDRQWTISLARLTSRATIQIVSCHDGAEKFEHPIGEHVFDF